MASLYIVFYLSTGKQFYGVLKLSGWIQAVLSFPHMGTLGSVLSLTLLQQITLFFKYLPEVGKADFELGNHLTLLSHIEIEVWDTDDTLTEHGSIWRRQMISVKYYLVQSIKLHISMYTFLLCSWNNGIENSYALFYKFSMVFIRKNVKCLASEITTV